MYLGRRVIVTDILTDPLWENYRHVAVRFGLRACWSTPIFSPQRKVLGSFAMYYREPRVPRDEELWLIDAAADIARVAIEQQRAYDALRHSEARVQAILRAIPDWIGDHGRRRHHRLPRQGWSKRAALGISQECQGSAAIIPGTAVPALAGERVDEPEKVSTPSPEGAERFFEAASSAATTRSSVTSRTSPIGGARSWRPRGELAHLAGSRCWRVRVSRTRCASRWPPSSATRRPRGTANRAPLDAEQPRAALTTSSGTTNAQAR